METVNQGSTATPALGNTITPPENAGNTERTFTQAEVDKIVGDRLQRDGKNYADYEDL